MYKSAISHFTVSLATVFTICFASSSALAGGALAINFNAGNFDGSMSSVTNHTGR